MVIFPAVAPLIDRLVRQLEGTVHGRQGASDELIRSAVLTAFLPHQAWLAVDAIARATYRRCVSRRRLLEWQTADAAERDSSRHMDSTRKQMIIIAAFSAVLMLVLYYWHRLVPTAGFLCLWMLSPFLLTWLNRTSAQRVPIDRCAFLTAIILGIVGSIIVSRPSLLSYGPTSRSQMRRGQQLIAAAAAAIAVAVTCEAILTSWRLAESHWTANSLLPLGSLVIEIGIVVASLVYIRNTVRRACAIMRHQASTSGSGESY